MKRYRLTPYDRARQGMMFADPHLGEPVQPPLTFDDPLPGAVRGGSGWTAVLHVQGQAVWHCAHRHRSEVGARACAWRERGVRSA